DLKFRGHVAHDFPEKFRLRFRKRKATPERIGVQAVVERRARNGRGNRIDCFDLGEMSQKIEIRNLAVVFHAKGLELEFTCLAFFKRVRSINQNAPGIILPDVIETTVQVFDVNRWFEILHQKERRPKKNHATMLATP